MVEAMCAAYDQCSCSQFPDLPQYPNAQACIDALTPQVQGGFDAAAGAGLSVNGPCLDAIVAAYGETQCEGGDQYEYAGSPLDVLDFCPLFVGTKGVGEACDSEALAVSLGDECSAGNLCGVDSTCVSDDYPSCEALFLDPFICRSGEACTNVDDQGQGGTCAQLPTEGEACIYMLQNEMAAMCGFGLVCDKMAGTCQPGPQAGEPCASDDVLTGICGPGAVCDENDMCVPAPAQGDPCVDFSCGSFDLECSEATDTCEPTVPIACLNPFAG